MVVLGTPVPRGPAGTGHDEAHDELHRLDGLRHRPQGVDLSGATSGAAGAINAAIAAAFAAGHGEVFLEPGIYNCNDGTVNGLLAAAYGITIRGSGWRTVLQKTNGGDVIELTGQHQGVENLMIDCRKNRSVSDGVLTNGSNVISSATASFAVGELVNGTGIHAFVKSVSGTSATLTSNATATATGVALAITSKGARSGILVRGYSAATTSYVSVRNLSLWNLYVRGCQEGIRFGHYSTLNGVTGDSGDADIAGNSYGNIWIEECDWGWIEDGQNILLNSVRGLFMNSITYSFTYQPRGGQVNVITGYFGASIAQPVTTVGSASNGATLPGYGPAATPITVTVADASAFPPHGVAAIGAQVISYTGKTGTTLTGVLGGSGTIATGNAVISTGWPQARAESSNLFLRDVRSECFPLGPTPPMVSTLPGNGTAHVICEGVYMTNPVGTTNVDACIFGGSLRLSQCVSNGKVLLHNTDYVGEGNEIGGGYIRTPTQLASSEVVSDFDPTNHGARVISGAVGKIRIGNQPSQVAYAGSPGAIFGDGSLTPVGFVGASGVCIAGFYLAGSTPQRANAYLFGTGTDGGVLGFQTKPDGSALRDVAILHDTMANGETILSLAVDQGGVESLKRIIVDGSGFLKVAP